MASPLIFGRGSGRSERGRFSPTSDQRRNFLLAANIALPRLEIVARWNLCKFDVVPRDYTLQGIIRPLGVLGDERADSKGTSFSLPGHKSERSLFSTGRFFADDIVQSYFILSVYPFLSPTSTIFPSRYIPTRTQNNQTSRRIPGKPARRSVGSPRIYNI